MELKIVGDRGHNDKFFSRGNGTRKHFTCRNLARSRNKRGRHGALSSGIELKWLCSLRAKRSNFSSAGSNSALCPVTIIRQVA